jgi:hypothetical protein
MPRGADLIFARRASQIISWALKSGAIQLCGKALRLGAQQEIPYGAMQEPGSLVEVPTAFQAHVSGGFINVLNLEEPFAACVEPLPYIPQLLLGLVRCQHLGVQLEKVLGILVDLAYESKRN